MMLSISLFESDDKGKEFYERTVVSCQLSKGLH